MSPRRRNGDQGSAVVNIAHAVDDWSRAAHAVDIVHTLDIAIAIVIVIAKVTNTG